MYLEEFIEGDRFVVTDFRDESIAEVYFMLGSGVNCGAVARDHKDPEQQEYPIVLRPEATPAIFRGIRKVIEGTAEGYLGGRPEDGLSVLSKIFDVSSDTGYYGLRRFFELTAQDSNNLRG